MAMRAEGGGGSTGVLMLVASLFLANHVQNVFGWSSFDIDEPFHPFSEHHVSE